MKDNKYNVKKDKKQSFNKTANYKKENDNEIYDDVLRKIKDRKRNKKEIEY